MLGTSIFTVALGLLSVATEAIQLAQRHESGTVVALKTERKQVVNPLHRDRLRRRQANTEPVDVTLDNAVGAPDLAEIIQNHLADGL